MKASVDAQSPGLIITADDFGLAGSVNAAVEQAYCEGVLSAASLMVAAPAAADAVARARTCPGLRVGLHLVLADGNAMLPPRAISDLVDADGRFDNRMARAGARFFLMPRVRRQLAAEIRAQFDAFAATGLALDHVNAHKHFHLHPTVLTLMIRIGRQFGLRAIRLPREPRLPPWLRPWIALLAHRLDGAGIAHNDYAIGLQQAGRMDEATLFAALTRLPPRGLGEIYLHPARRSGAAISASAAGYRHADELAALVSPRIRAACDGLQDRGYRFGGFADLTGPR